VNPARPVGNFTTVKRDYTRKASFARPLPPIQARSSSNVAESVAESEQHMEIDKHNVIVQQDAPQIDDSPFTFINFLKDHPDTKEFVYLVPNNDLAKYGLAFNPYNLRIVQFSQINTKSPQGFFTMSSDVYFFDIGSHTFRPAWTWRIHSP
jgi:hypothetical protein